MYKCMLLLFLTVVVLKPAQGRLEENVRAYPCPNEEDIDPCTCTVISNELYMDCSEVSDDAEFERVFQAYFPFWEYNTFRMVKDAANPVPVTTLDVNSFGPLSFKRVEISYTDLFEVGVRTFNRSYDILETVIITNSKLLYFPFDEMTSCPKLTTLQLQQNELLHMSDLRTTSLTEIDLGQNPLLKFGDQAFLSAPALVTINLTSAGVTHIAGGAFSAQTGLVSLDLSGNTLEVLEADSLKFTSSVIADVNLDFNPIAHVHEEFISGISAETSLSMVDTLLRDMPDHVWEPVFIQVTPTTSPVISIINNPLECGCNLKWLVTNPTYMQALDPLTACFDGMLVHNLDEGFLETNCP